MKAPIHDPPSSSDEDTGHDAPTTLMDRGGAQRQVGDDLPTALLKQGRPIAPKLRIIPPPSPDDPESETTQSAIPVRRVRTQGSRAPRGVTTTLRSPGVRPKRSSKKAAITAACLGIILGAAGAALWGRQWAVGVDEAPPSTVAEAPSTQATAEASVAARATAAVAPTELELQIWLRPSAAVVRMDGKLLELPGGPFRVQCTGTTTLRFEAEGYQPKTRTVTCGGTAVLDIVLEKQKP